MPSTDTDGHQSFPQTVFEKYFSLKVPAALLKEKSISAMMDFLKQNNLKSYKNDFKKNELETYYGTFQFNEKGAQFLWVYENQNVHSGKLVVFNENLEIVYLKKDMGCLYELEVKDLLQNNQNVLLITHGAGGTGVYCKIIDLIVYQDGILESKGALLKELRNSIMGEDPLEINCHTEISVGSGKSGNELVVDLVAEANLDLKEVKPETVKRVNDYLQEHFQLRLNTSKRESQVVVIEDLNTPIIRGNGSPSLCTVYMGPYREWPLSIRAQSAIR
jgi:hypothetical protein